jgi:hypothetical protein
VRISLTNGQHVCTFKKGSEPEHRVYWKLVKQDPHFSSDPLFQLNDEKRDVSDAGHRGLANYADHVNRFPALRIPDEQTIFDRVERISKIACATPPIPDRSKFPDIESVQIVAYHRIVRFRRLIDNILGGENRFWNVHRSPSWARHAIDYQLVEQDTLAATGLSE